MKKSKKQISAFLVQGWRSSFFGRKRKKPATSDFCASCAGVAEWSNVLG